MREARIHQLQIKSMDAAYSSSPRQRAHPGERDRSTSHVADLFALGQLAAEPLCQRLRSSPAGLTYEEAARRLQDFGLNLVARERKPTILQEIWGRARNPLNALLLTLAAVSYFIGDMRAAPNLLQDRWFSLARDQVEPEILESACGFFVGEAREARSEPLAQRLGRELT